MADALRERLYESYSSGGPSDAPKDLSELAPRAGYFRHVIDRHFPADRGSCVFDVGCGYGALMHFAREAGYQNVRGVDGSPEMLLIAKRLGIDGVEQGDLLESLESLPAESQDVILAFDVVEHFAKDELLRLVDAVHRVLRPSGVWIMLVPNGESPFFGGIRYGDLTHELAFTADSVSQLLMASGFSGVESFEVEPLGGGPVGLARRMVWKLVRAAMRVSLAAETGRRNGLFTRNLLAVGRK